MSAPFAEAPDGHTSVVGTVIAISRFGGVFSEIATWLGDTIGATVSTSEQALERRPSRLILVGAGLEFDRLLRQRRRQARRPPVVLWAFDPFPPPDVPAAALQRGLRAGRWAYRFRRLDIALGPFGSTASGLTRPLRTAALRFSSGRRAMLAEGTQAARDPQRAVFAFERLAWLAKAIERRDIDQVFVSAKSAQASLARKGIAAGYQPVARHDGMGASLKTPRDIPVLFLGATHDARAARVLALREALHHRGIPLTIVDRQCYGAERTALLNRAAIVVNLHKYPWHFERIRFYLAIANGALFVTESPAADPDPFEPGRHFVVAAADRIADAVAEHLEHATSRTAIVAAATALFRQQPDFRAAGQLLQSAPD